MIDVIHLNCGRTPESEPLMLDGREGMTIFVGPNNSGKSAILRALHGSICGTGRVPPSSLAQIIFKQFHAQILEGIHAFKGKANDEIVEVDGNRRSKIDIIEILAEAANWTNVGSYGARFRKLLCIWMDGKTGLGMLPNEGNANLTNPNAPLAWLFTDDERRTEFQQTVFDGIGHYPFIDRVSNYGSLKLAFSTAKPGPEVERGTDARLIEFVRSSKSREAVSDGFNAYVGMLGAIYATDFKCLFIDEPEAFLHPALARTLGKQIALKGGEQQIFIASHSADFLMGAIESGQPVRIVRLQYQDGVGTACLLDGDELREFMQNPLLRSADVLSGLFAKSVFVGEADTDRAFYQEINTRFLSSRDPRGIVNVVFLNAQNKQTVPKIVGMLRKMGVPAIGIVDLDVVAEGGAVWTTQMDGAGLPAAMRESLSSQQNTTIRNLKAKSADEKKKDYKWHGGISLLENDDREAAEALFATLADYGLFVVPNGEVEAWLSSLDIPKEKSKWLAQIFEKMGADPQAEDYSSPSEGDVWDFIGACNDWLTNPARKGMSPPPQ